MNLKSILRSVLFIHLVTLPAASHADDATWLQQKGTLIFQDTFDRQLDGNGIKAITSRQTTKTWR